MFSNIRILSTWNIWGAPFGVEFIFHKHDAVREFNDRHVLNLLHQRNTMTILQSGSVQKQSTAGPLIISTFQEAFTFRNVPGLFDTYSKIPAQSLYNTPSLLSSLQTSYFYECIVCAMAILYRPFQRKHDFYSTQNKIFQSPAALLPFEYAYGINGESMSMEKPYQMMADSGLLILSTWKPIECGFTAFESQASSWGSWTDEQFANKGMLWAYWKKEDIGTIVVNTHMNADSRHKQYLQLNELAHLIGGLKKKYIGYTKGLEVYVVGDFNVEYNDPHLNEVMVNSLGFEVVTEFVDNEICGNIDHIMMWNNFGDKSGHAQTFQETANPPLFIENDFKKNYLSDHAWRGIINVALE